MCKNKQAASKLAGGDKYMRKTSDIGAKKAQDDFMEDQDAVNLAADWADISQGLRKDLGHQLHSQWIKPIQVGGIDRDTGTLDLFLPTEFSANWVKDRFADRLSLAWKIARSEVRDVRIQVHPGRRQVADLRLHADGRRPANDGADNTNGDAVVNVYNWADYIAPDTIERFEAEFGFGNSDSCPARIQFRQTIFSISSSGSSWVINSCAAIDPCAIRSSARRTCSGVWWNTPWMRTSS